MARNSWHWFALTLVILGGCIGSLGGEETSTPNYERMVVVTGADTTIERNDSQFSMHGTVGIQLGGTPSPLNDTYLCLYDPQKDLVHAHPIGTLDWDDNNYRRVDIDLDQPVEYIVVDHPKLHRYEQAGPLWLAYDREFDQYRDFDSLDVSLDYNVSDMKGGCAEVSEA